MILLLFSICSVLYAMLIMVFYWHWRQIPILYDSSIEKQIKVTVLIPVRNEEKGILQLLEDIKAQDYPKNLLEVIVIDDYSTDNTRQIILAHKAQFLYHLRLINLDVLDDYEGSHKKSAITQAVQLANGELIINTDGDCRVGVKWISTFVALYLERDAQFISGPVTFHHEKSLFEKLQTLEFASLIGVGAAAMQMHKPNMCNGANLAFKKSVFKEVNGYEGIDQVHSGDDEFLMHKIFEKHPKGVFFLKENDAVVKTYATPNLTELIYQRKRWAGKWKYYKNLNIKLLAVFIFLYNFLFFITFFSVLCGKYSLKIFVLQLIIKFIADFIFVKSIMQFLKKQFVVIHFLTIELFYPFYAVFFGIVSNFGKYEWKGRRLKR